jgi:phosphoribosylglycinamide formyltransferase-1
MNNIAIFASGTGSNFVAINQSIINKELNANLVLLVSDKPECKAIKTANELQIKTFSFEPKNYKKKKQFEQEIVQKLQEENVDLIVLAGYMRLIGETLLSEYKNRIINIHPSYLPHFKGKDAIGQALIHRPEYTGVTVHYVDEGMDTGSIIEQVKIDLLENETRETLEQRVHKLEHMLYPKVIKKVLEEL